MPLAFGGTFLVARSIDEVYDFLADPHRFAPILPHFQGLRVIDERNFEVRVKVGVAHIQGVADVKLTLAEFDRPHHLRYVGKGSLARDSVNLSAGFDLQATAEGTQVAWKGKAQISGILASLAGGLLQPLAQKNAQKAIDGLQAAISQPSVISNQSPDAGVQSMAVGSELPAVSRPSLEASESDIIVAGTPSPKTE